MTDRVYPEDVAGPFPTPPRTVVDDEGRRIEYRLADSDDYDSLLDMYDRFDPADRAQGIPPANQDDLETWLATLLSEGCLNAVAAHDGTIVGHAVLVPEGHQTVSHVGAPRGAEVPEIGRRGPTGSSKPAGTRGDDADDIDATTRELAIFVVQPYQSAGIGGELLETLLGAGSERGVARVWLAVERWNEPAVALYRSVGFETCNAEAFELKMSLRLA